MSSPAPEHRQRSPKRNPPHRPALPTLLGLGAAVLLLAWSLAPRAGPLALGPAEDAAAHAIVAPLFGESLRAPGADPEAPLVSVQRALGVWTGITERSLRIGSWMAIALGGLAALALAAGRGPRAVVATGALLAVWPHWLHAPGIAPDAFHALAGGLALGAIPWVARASLGGLLALLVAAAWAPATSPLGSVGIGVLLLGPLLVPAAAAQRAGLAARARGLVGPLAWLASLLLSSGGSVEAALGRLAPSAAPALGTPIGSVALALGPGLDRAWMPAALACAALLLAVSRTAWPQLLAEPVGPANPRHGAAGSQDTSDSHPHANRHGAPTEPRLGLPSATLPAALGALTLIGFAVASDVAGAPGWPIFLPATLLALGALFGQARWPLLIALLILPLTAGIADAWKAYRTPAPIDLRPWLDRAGGAAERGGVLLLSGPRRFGLAWYARAGHATGLERRIVPEEWSPEAVAAGLRERYRLDPDAIAPAPRTIAVPTPLPEWPGTQVIAVVEEAGQIALLGLTVPDAAETTQR